MRRWRVDLTAVTLAAIVIIVLPLVAKSDPLPNQCAKAKGITNERWEFRNDCPYTVYWVVVCAITAVQCYGKATIVVDPGSRASRELLHGPWEIGGAYK